MGIRDKIKDTIKDGRDLVKLVRSGEWGKQRDKLDKIYLEATSAPNKLKAIQRIDSSTRMRKSRLIRQNGRAAGSPSSSPST